MSCTAGENPHNCTMQGLENDDDARRRLSRTVLVTWIVNAGGITVLVIAGWWAATTHPLP